MLRRHEVIRRLRACPWPVTVVTSMVVLLLAAVPALLVPVAHGYRAVCAAYPPLAQLTNHMPPLPLALLLILAALALGNGARAGAVQLMGTLRFNRTLRRQAAPLPLRLSAAGATLGLSNRLTYLEHALPAAFCYGLLRPRIAVTAGLLDRLDDEALAAVLAHERQHLRRRDPARYLAIHALSAAAFMFPLAPALRQRLEARIELGADRAALAVAPRGALAAALLALLATPPMRVPGAAALTATEARIAQLAGRPVLPAIPAPAWVGSLGLAAVIAVATIDLAASADLVKMACALYPDLP
ncbi:MAG: M56 family metallopeptidase [Chloroflexota bacterium]|nr:M56 family metallopeptidase [Chloroflexota bacterium]